MRGPHRARVGGGIIAQELRLLATAALLTFGSTVAMAQTFSGLRGPTPIDQAPVAEPLTPEQNMSHQEPRNYPEQPPLIPHSTEGYEISVRGNKCLSCHARSRVGESQAPMVSITHFADRDGQFLATVSPRRYFCTQCHVPQHDAKVPIKNDFVDIDSLLTSTTPGRYPSHATHRFPGFRPRATSQPKR